MVIQSKETYRRDFSIIQIRYKGSTMLVQLGKAHLGEGEIDLGCKVVESFF